MFYLVSSKGNGSDEASGREMSLIVRATSAEKAAELGGQEFAQFPFLKEKPRTCDAVLELSDEAKESFESFGMFGPFSGLNIVHGESNSWYRYSPDDDWIAYPEKNSPLRDNDEVSVRLYVVAGCSDRQQDTGSDDMFLLMRAASRDQAVEMAQKEFGKISLTDGQSINCFAVHELHDIRSAGSNEYLVMGALYKMRQS